MDPIHVRGRDWCFKENRTVRQTMRSESGRTNLFFRHRELSIHERLIRFVNCSFRAVNFRKVQINGVQAPSTAKFCFFLLWKGLEHHLFFSEIYIILFLFAVKLDWSPFFLFWNLQHFVSFCYRRGLNTIFTFLKFTARKKQQQSVSKRSIFQALRDPADVLLRRTFRPSTSISCKYSNSCLNKKDNV